jgi:hypothetical protein
MNTNQCNDIAHAFSHTFGLLMHIVLPGYGIDLFGQEEGPVAGTCELSNTVFQ